MADRPRDVVFTFSYETWDDAVRRGMMRPPDRVLTSLLGSSRVRRLVVADPYRSVLSTVARRSRAPFPGSEGRRLVRPLRLRQRDPVDLAALARTYARYGAALRRRASSLDLTEPVVITTHPLVAGFGELAWAERVLYFGRDDWASSPARRPYWPAYRAAYERIAHGGVRVAAVSQEILDRIRPTAPSAVIPNGIDPDEWAGPRPAAPAWFATTSRPRAIYTGTIDSRLDVAGLRVLADRMPAVTFVLLGPVADEGHVRPLRGLPNVVLHPAVGRSELVAATRNADVALLAHVRSPLTEAMSPLKAYEYVAAGLPVVSIDLAPMRLLGTHVRVAAEVAEFEAPIRRAIDAGPLPEPRRLEFLRENSWARRHEALFDLLF